MPPVLFVQGLQAQVLPVPRPATLHRGSSSLLSSMASKTVHPSPLISQAEAPSSSSLTTHFCPVCNLTVNSAAVLRVSHQAILGTQPDLVSALHASSNAPAAFWLRF